MSTPTVGDSVRPDGNINDDRHLRRPARPRLHLMQSTPEWPGSGAFEEVRRHTPLLARMACQRAPHTERDLRIHRIRVAAGLGREHGRRRASGAIIDSLLNIMLIIGALRKRAGRRITLLSCLTELEAVSPKLRHPQDRLTQVEASGVSSHPI
jgi:hypothetical protein